MISIERVMRKRVVRLALALLLMGAAGWAFLPYLTHRIAASAFVNSELVRVTAPFPGRLTQALPRKGDLIHGSASLNLLEALSPDRRHLLDLQLQYALAKQTGNLARRQLDEIATIDVELGKRAEAYRLALMDQIRHEALEAEVERDGCLGELKQRSEIGLRMSTLTETGLASPIRSAEAHAMQQAASTRCAVAAARVDRIQVALHALHEGIFLRDGVSDVPYSQQQRDRLVLRRQELEMRVVEESARVSKLAAEIDAERERIGRLDNYKPVLPSGHVVWSTAVSPGSAVVEGQTILDLADCAHRFVAVELPERDFEQIRTGDIAEVRLLGSSEWRQGLVQQIRGSAARTDDRLFAAQIPSPSPGTITVEVSLPGDEELADGANFCGIGRLAEVRFRRQLFNIADAVTAAWRRLTRWHDAPALLQTAAGG